MFYLFIAQNKIDERQRCKIHFIFKACSLLYAFISCKLHVPTYVMDPPPSHRSPVIIKESMRACAERDKRMSGQWAKYSFFITRGRGRGLPSVSAGALALSECTIIFQLPRKAKLPAELRCASRGGRFSANCSALRSLLFHSPSFITLILRTRLRHLHERGEKVASKVADNKFGHAFLPAITQESQ